MDESKIREALNRHWAASDANEFDVEHDIYREDAVLEYPQSGERIRGRHNIQASRTVQPNFKRFTVRRIVGSGDLWVTEFILTYDGRPVPTTVQASWSSWMARWPMRLNTLATRSSPALRARTWLNECNEPARQ